VKLAIQNTLAANKWVAGKDHRPLGFVLLWEVTPLSRFGLPADLASCGLCGVLRKYVTTLRKAVSSVGSLLWGTFAMIDEPKSSLPEGHTDPNELYIAVGRAIHAWENMEEAFARLYAKFMGLPERPDALVDYGAENRRFVDRMAALKAAGDSYFIRKPNQEKEGQLQELIKTARDLSIKRHRVAHGHITTAGQFRLPDTKGPFEITPTFHYRWGAPWYSLETLRTNPIGVNAAMIEKDQKAFEFTSELSS
jgi:hypothetical protein